MLIKWYRVIKLRRCIAKPKNSMIVCARTVTEEGMELSAVVIMCLNSAPKSAQVLPSCCLVLHLQCVLFLDVLLVAQPSGRRSTENKTWAARLAIVTCFSLRRLANDAFPLSVGLAGQAEERSQLVIPRPCCRHHPLRRHPNHGWSCAAPAPARAPGLAFFRRAVVA